MLSGCWSAAFQQPKDGQFRIPYSRPDAYHLTFSARGYHDAEAYTPKVAQLEKITGINVKLKKKVDGTVPELRQQTLAGTVTRQGKPVKTGWVGLWMMPRQYDRVSPHMLRGRTVVGDPAVYESTPIRDGKYLLNVRFQDDDWYVAAEEPDQPVTVVGPIKIKLNEKKQLDIACAEGGSIRGRHQERALGLGRQSLGGGVHEDRHPGRSPSDRERRVFLSAITAGRVRTQGRSRRLS